MEFESAFDYFKTIENKENNHEKYLFKAGMSNEEKLSALNSKEITGLLYDKLAIHGDDSYTYISDFKESNGYYYAEIYDHYDNRGHANSTQYYEMFVNPDTENSTIIYKEYSSDDYDISEKFNLTELMKENNLNLNLVEENAMEINNQSDHIISLNLLHEGETIGSLDMLDGDTGKTYSLGIWDGGNRDNLYVCPLDPKIDMEERDVTYLNELLSPEVCQRVENAYDKQEIDSLVLRDDDLLIDKSELIQNERFADWMERIENGDRNFSEKELSVYQEMTKEDYPELNDLEARTDGKDNDISIDSAEKIISGYVQKMNGENPLVESKTDNQLRQQYELISTDKDYEGDSLKMKYIDRNNLGVGTKTFSYNQESGMVSEFDTKMKRGSDNMIAPEVTMIDRLNIKEMESQVNTQSIKEEKTITHTRIAQEEGMER